MMRTYQETGKTMVSFDPKFKVGLRAFGFAVTERVVIDNYDIVPLVMGSLRLVTKFIVELLSRIFWSLFEKDRHQEKIRSPYFLLSPSIVIY